MDENAISVIVGVGQVNDRDDRLNSVELMAAALRNADSDAGGGWLDRADTLDVVAQLSFPEFADASAPLAHMLEIAPRHCAQTRYPMGDSPVALLDAAAKRIAAGDAEICVVAGGEALRTAAKRAAGKRDAVRDSATQATRATRPGRERYGIIAPTDVYPLYENACRAAWGQSFAEAQHESAAIWARFSEVAAQNEAAWLREAREAHEILTVTPNNRAIAFPYTKYMVANASVNQGAGFIVTSLAKAKQMGVAETKIIYIGHGAAGRELGDVLAREQLNHSPSLERTLRSTLDDNGISTADLDYVELYSCFPCVPKMARRAIDWPLDKPMSVSGGLTFGGGPVGNYMSHAIAAMTEALRAKGRHGLLFGNGGLATTSHAIIVSRDPAVARRNAPVAPANGEPRRVEVLESYEGEASIETYTVFYDRGGAAASGVIVARAKNGSRFLARVDGDDEALIAFLTSGEREPVGTRGAASLGADDLVRWRMR
jgi:acetyl-CoA C-acetyltransferase